MGNTNSITMKSLLKTNTELKKNVSY